MISHKCYLPLLVVFLSAASCFGQATRTWVSGVGDDANPGSRTAPCKTFFGDLAKTAAGGEIDVLDPGDFGPVTITQSVTIDGGPGVAGVIPGGGAAFTITGTGATPIIVTLKNLDINGVGQGTDGIDVSGAVILHVQNCEIYGFTGKGISFAVSGSGSALFVQNTHVHETGADGIAFLPAVQALAEIQDSQIDDCANGVHAGSKAYLVAHNVSATGNTGAGFQDDAGAVLVIQDSDASLNGTGISAAGKITLSDVSIVDNLTVDITHAKGGVVDSFHNNPEVGVGGTATDGSPTTYLPNH
jgi:hypothetical protein